MNNPSYVLDTNVIIHDPRAHYSFKESKVIIPITVLEELDKFKSGNDLKAKNARDFIRDIESKKHEWLTFSLLEDANETVNDNKILACAIAEKAAIVTKDINLRIKAQAFGVPAQDYDVDKVSNIEDLLRKTRVEEARYPELMESLFTEEDGVQIIDGCYDHNEYFILKSGTASALVKYDDTDAKLRVVKTRTVTGVTPKNAEQTFAIDALMNDDIPLVALTGKAGTGKTLMALASAIAAKRNYTQIFLARPTVDMERDIGFLPGSMEEKLAPYLAPFHDNLKFIRELMAEKTQKTLDKMKEDGKIQIEALNYIRGRSLPRVYFIIDEAQNLTPHEVKTIVTRAGEGAKLVFMGDLDQIDTPYLDQSSNGLAYLIDKMSGQELFAHVKLVKGERSKLAELASDIL